MFIRIGDSQHRAVRHRSFPAPRRLGSAKRPSLSYSSGNNRVQVSGEGAGMREWFRKRGTSPRGPNNGQRKPLRVGMWSGGSAQRESRAVALGVTTLEVRHGLPGFPPRCRGGAHQIINSMILVSEFVATLLGSCPINRNAPGLWAGIIRIGRCRSW